MKKTTLAILALILITTSSVFAQANKLETAKRVEQTDKLVKPIEAYAKTIEDFVEKEDKPHKFFARVSDRKLKKSFWLEYDSAESFEKANKWSYETAAVWEKDGKIVYVSMAYSSESGDWFEYYNQIYRQDGTLAKLNRELRTFYGNVIANRIKIYDRNVKLLKESKSLRDLYTDKLLKESEANYMNVEAGTMYQKTSDLPFLSAKKNVTIAQTSYVDKDFVPTGWKLETKTVGDLNGDKVPDSVLQLIKEESDNDDGFSRTLVVLIRENDNKLTKYAEARNLLLCRGCGGMLGGAASIEIKKGVLLVSQLSGSREGTSILHRFRYESSSKRFRLIGVDRNDFDRLELSSEATSTNYLTGRQIITKSKGGENAVEETVTRKRVSRSKIYLEEVNYGN